MSKQSVVWLDHKEARIFELRVDAFVESSVDAPAPERHSGGVLDAAAQAQDQANRRRRYFDALAQALETSEEILVVGPGKAKLDFLRYAARHQPALEPKIVGIETVDQPSNRQLISYAKTYLLAKRSP
jgi:stalled ribosome rescue protein Dom34